MPKNAGVDGRFRRELLAWYRRDRRDLPWRGTGDPYRIWVSEVMLQQTQAATVVPYYGRFLKLFPTVRALAKAQVDRLMKSWEGLGYYARARNFREAAKQVVAEFGGRIPRDPEKFSGLPGAGPYTTAAVMSIAFGKPLAALDGNVKRVIARLFDIDRLIVAEDIEVRRHADALLDRRHPGDFNQAMMELGARVCTPKHPSCLLCPVRRYCRAEKNGTVSRRPVRAPKKSRPHRMVVAGIIERDGRVLIGRRPASGLLGGLWEFPGGKVEKGETLEQALTRELREELGVVVAAGREVARVDHAYTHFSITLTGHRCRIRSGDPKPLVHSAIRWIRPAELSRYAMPEANRKLMGKIFSRGI